MFQNRETHARSPAHEVALDCLAAGIRGADPEQATRNALSLAGDRLTIETGDTTHRVDLTRFDRLLVLAGGKATRSVVHALDALLGDRITDGLVIVPEDDPAVGDRIGAIAVTAGGHPVPTESGADATDRLLELAEAADKQTLVLTAITGGASALVAAPAGDLSVDDLQGVTRVLLEAGADITALNTVRKHLSRVKGGRLAVACAPAQIVTLAVSDVVGDPPSVIGSGPTAPDDTTYDDALTVLSHYEIDVPAVHAHLEAGAAGTYSETPGSGDPVVADIPIHLVAGSRTAIDAAAEAATDRGYEPCVLSSRVRGEASSTAPTHVAIAEEVATNGDPVEPPAVLLSGGETTVDVQGDGDGGPNTEFALAAALELTPVVDEVMSRVVVATLDTDGRDGARNAAGALVDSTAVDDDERARDALAQNDSLGYLRGRGAALVTGPTGTNVNDLRALVVPRPRD